MKGGAFPRFKIILEGATMERPEMKVLYHETALVTSPAFSIFENGTRWVP
jgi:hypothetical protein